MGWEVAESAAAIDYLLSFFFGCIFCVYLVPAFFALSTIISNLVAFVMLLLVHNHVEIGVNLLAAEAGRRVVTKLIAVASYTTAPRSFRRVFIIAIIFALILPSSAVLDFGAIGGPTDGPPPALADNPLVAPMDTGDASPSPAADNGVLGAVLGAAQAIANVVQPQPAAMRFTRRPPEIPAEPAPGAVRYARSGGGLGWAKIPTQFDTELEVRWFDGRLFAKVTAESIPPLAPFIKSDSDHEKSWRRRIAWLTKQRLYCEAHPRSDADSCVMEWRALQRLLSVRNLTDGKGNKDKSPCVPATQYDADDLYTWEEWAQQVRALDLGFEKRESALQCRDTLIVRAGAVVLARGSARVRAARERSICRTRRQRHASERGRSVQPIRQIRLAQTWLHQGTD